MINLYKQKMNFLCIFLLNLMQCRNTNKSLEIFILKMKGKGKIIDSIIEIGHILGQDKKIDQISEKPNNK